MAKKKNPFPNYRGYSIEEKEAKCRAFYWELAKALEDSHESVGSCNKDASCYLVPFGTEEQITYSGKPQNSFRISDHWNWKANATKNPCEGYVQCFTKDLPPFRKRTEPGKASLPIWGWQVSYFGTDEQYHCIYGEKFNRKKREWEWIETDIPDILEKMEECRKNGLEGLMM